MSFILSSINIDKHDDLQMKHCFTHDLTLFTSFECVKKVPFKEYQKKGHISHNFIFSALHTEIGFSVSTFIFSQNCTHDLYLQITQYIQITRQTFHCYSIPMSILKAYKNTYLSDGYVFSST